MSSEIKLMVAGIQLKWFACLAVVFVVFLLLFPVLSEAFTPQDLADAVEAAEEAIAELPESINMDSIQEHRMNIRIARHLVDEALALGAVEADIDNLAKLVALEEAVEDMYSQDYMRQSILALPPPHPDDIEGMAIFVRNRDPRWWEDDHFINGICFLPLGSASISYTNIHDPRWVDYDISGRGYTYVKGYIGIADSTSREDYPVTFQIHGDGDLLYEELIDYGEDASFYLLDIEGVDTLRIGWFAEVTDEGGGANEIIVVEPQFLLPITPDMLDAMEAAGNAIAALPAEPTLDDEDDIKAARALVEDALALGVEKDRIGNLEDLYSAEEVITNIYYTNYALESLHVLGDPGSDNRSSGWFVDFPNEDRWRVEDQPGDRGFVNFRSFEPLKVFTRSLSAVAPPEGVYARWDISEKNYHYIEGYVGASDISTHMAFPLDFIIYGDGVPLYEAYLEYGKEAKFYRVNLEGVTELKIQYVAQELTSGGYANTPVITEPQFLIPFDTVVQEVEEAIANIPDPVTMEDVMPVRIARLILDRAVEGGTDEADIGNLDILLAAEDTIENLYDNYMMQSILDLREPHPDDISGMAILVRNRAERWWPTSPRPINGMCFLPLGSVSLNYVNIHNVRWAEYDVSDMNYSYVKGYVGIDDGSSNTDFPVTFQIHLDGDLVYEKILEYGEYPEFYLLDLEGVEKVRFGWYAQETTGESDTANTVVFVEPRFLTQISPAIAEAVENAEEAIAAIPEYVSLLDETAVRNARQKVDMALDLGVEIIKPRPDWIEGSAYEDSIEGLERLYAAEEAIRNFYFQYYDLDSIIQLGDPGSDNRSTTWLYDPGRWEIDTDTSIERAVANFQTFEPRLTWHWRLGDLDTNPRWTEWDISEKGYKYMEGYAGISDTTTNFGMPLDFYIIADGVTVLELKLHYGNLVHYRIDLEGVEKFQIKYGASGPVTGGGYAMTPVFVEPLFMHSPWLDYAVELAEDAIAFIPAEITIDDINLVKEARVMVNNALSIGADEEEINNLADLLAAEKEVAKLETLPGLIADAIAAIDALPDPADVTNDDRAAANAARSLVDEALDLGADEADITNLAHLEAVEAALDDIWAVVYGDVNEDGVINVEDVVLTMQYILGLAQLDENQQEAADVNGDGQINVEDVVLIMQRVLGLISEFPVES